MQSPLFTITGFVCLPAGLIFGLFNQVQTAAGWAPNVTNAGASCGFAIAGGLCFLSAAIARRDGGPRETGE